MKRGIAALCCAALLLGATIPVSVMAMSAAGAMAMPAAIDTIVAVDDDAAEEILATQKEAEAAELSQYDPNVTLSVRYDYDNALRPLAMPAFITVDNRGDAFSATLRLYLVSSYGNSSTVYEMPVEVGANAASEFILPFGGSDGNSSLYLRLERPDGSPMAGVKTEVGYMYTSTRAQEGITINPARYSSDMLVGVLSDNPDALGYWLDSNGLRDENGLVCRVKGVELTEKTFPDRYYFLDRFALIVLNNFDIKRLSAEQQACLTGWVKSGGHLIVDGDPVGAAVLPSLSDLLSLRGDGEASPTGARQALMDFTHWRPSTDEVNDAEFAALGRVQPTGNVVLSLEGATPLIMKHEAGSGAVFVTGFALSDPVLSLRGARQIFAAIPGMSARAGQDNTQGYYAGMMNNDAQTVKGIEWMDAPSINWMLGLLLVFIVIAAPVSYFILAKRDKRDLIWITAPILALLCCGIIAGYGLHQRGNQPVSSVITVVDQRTRRQLPAFSTVGVGANKQGAYTAQFEEDAFPQSMDSNQYAPYYSSYPGGVMPVEEAAANSGLRADVGGYPKVTFPEIAQWDMQTLSLRRDLSLEGPLEAVMTMTPGGVNYWVKNNTEVTLEDVTLVHSKGYTRLPALAPGEEASGALTTYRALQAGSGYGMMTMDVWNICSELYGGPAANYYGGPDPVPEDDRSTEQKREDFIKGSLVQNQLQAAAMYSSMGRATVSAVWGWSSELGELPMTVNGQSPRNALNLALVINDAAVNYTSEGRLTLPEGEIFGEVSGSIGVSGGQVMQGSQYAYIENGEVIFDFQLPDKLKDYSVDKLAVHGYNIYGNYKASLYNFRTGDWDDYTVNKSISGDQAGDYVAPWNADTEVEAADPAADAAANSPTGTSASPELDNVDAVNPSEVVAPTPNAGADTSGTDFERPTDASRAPNPGTVRIKFAVKSPEDTAEDPQAALTPGVEMAVEAPGLNVDSLSISVSGKEKANAGH